MSETHLRRRAKAPLWAFGYRNGWLRSVWRKSPICAALVERFFSFRRRRMQHGVTTSPIAFPRFQRLHRPGFSGVENTLPTVENNLTKIFFKALLRRLHFRRRENKNHRAQIRSKSLDSRRKKCRSKIIWTSTCYPGKSRTPSMPPLGPKLPIPFYSS